MAKFRIRVAVVDDDASVRRALGRLLRTAGFDVETFGSGAELLQALSRFNPDCIILDLHMQEMNGLDVQRHLARIGSPAPVIIITGHDDSKARSEAIALGASAYLAKPIEENLLVTTIEQAVASIKSCA